MKLSRLAPAEREQTQPMGIQMKPLLLATLVFAVCSPAVLAQTAGTLLAVPSESTIPSGALGDAVRRGKALLTDTRQLLPGHVGNGLNCTNCHLGGGTVAYASPWVGLAGAFPEYRSRSGKIISLQERINDCFQRSMNGQPLAFDSADMNANMAYMKWLSTGVPTGADVTGRGFEKIDTALRPDPAHGKAVYGEKCVSCHGAEGLGIANPQGGYAIPPVWGKDSFNVGAGMARMYTAAAFVRHNMPLGQGGTLSAQDAIDVAAYFTRQPRPDYPGRANDWPKGGRPVDAR